MRKLRYAEKLTDQLTSAYEGFHGSDRNEGAVDLLVSAQAALNAAARVEESYAALAAETEDLRYRAEDLAERLEDARRELDYSPGELDRLEEQGFDRSYIPTEYTGLYEHYGYRYLRDIVNYGGGTDRLYVKEL